MQDKLKAKLEDSRYNIAMENHEFGVAPEAFQKWPILNATYDVVSTSKDRYRVLYAQDCMAFMYCILRTLDTHCVDITGAW